MQVRGLEIWNKKTVFEKDVNDNEINPFPWNDNPNNDSFSEYNLNLFNGIKIWETNLLENLNPLRKIFLSGGSDAHGDLNYQTYQAIIGGIKAQDNALAKVRTVAYCPNGIDDNNENIFRALWNGNTIVTDGPLLIFNIDLNGNKTIENDEPKIGDNATCNLINIENGTIGIFLKWNTSPEFGGKIVHLDLYINDNYISLYNLSGIGSSIKDSILISLKDIKNEFTTIYSDFSFILDEYSLFRIEAFTNKQLYRCYTNPIWIKFIDTPQKPTLEAGTVIPATGNTDDIFEFQVTYKSPQNMAPDGGVVILNIDGSNYNMQSTASNWQDGVKFTKTLNDLQKGEHYYYFTASSDGVNLRFPETGNMPTLRVSESAIGWDLEITDLNLSSNYLMPGENFTATAKVHNNSNSPDKVFTNVLCRYEFFDQSGNLIDEKSANIDRLEQLQSKNVIGNFTIPSNAQNENYRLNFTISPDLDQNSNNNTASKIIIVGSDGPSYQFFITDNNEWIQMDENNPSHHFEESEYTITTINTNNDYIYIKQDSWNPKKINLYDFRFYNSGNIVLICEGISDIGYESAFISFGTENTDHVTFTNTNVTCLPGSRIQFVAECLNYGFENSDPDFYKNSEVENWFLDIRRENSNKKALFKFQVQNSASPGQYSFFMGAKLNNGKFLRELTITILIPPPEITQIKNDTLSADDEIQIIGTNFSNNGTVNFNLLNAQHINTWSNTSISCIVPEGVESGNIYITNENGVSNSFSYQIISSTGDPEVITHIPDQSMETNTLRFINEIKNIFWDPNGDDLSISMSLDTNIIKFSSDSLTNGKLYLLSKSTAGSQTIIISAKDADNVTVSDTFAVNIVSRIIPVELSNFSAEINKAEIILTWQTESETNNFGFEVQKSLDEKNFKKIAFLKGKGTTSVPQKYKYIDSELLFQSDKNYYRLKQIDTDGKYNFSKVICVLNTKIKKYTLRQNYPNPFNPETIIQYSIPKDGFVTIDIYDIRGQLLRNLVSQQKLAGVHSINWDGKDNNGIKVSSGLYLYRFKFGNLSTSKKMLLMK